MQVDFGTSWQERPNWKPQQYCHRPKNLYNDDGSAKSSMSQRASYQRQLLYNLRTSMQYKIYNNNNSNNNNNKNNSVYLRSRVDSSASNVSLVNASRNYDTENQQNKQICTAECRLHAHSLETRLKLGMHSDRNYSQNIIRARNKKVLQSNLR